jgi:glycosyltransferase involved in cell wall biosynthesis
MPVRNEESHLPAALSSIFSQTFTDWELVAVDDGSTDATRHVLEEAARREPRMRILSTGGKGLVKALNLGLDACSGRLVARMDGDDICHPSRLRVQSDFLEKNPDVALVACSFRHFPRSGLGSGMLAYEEWQNSLDSHEAILRDLYVESPFVHPTVMFRKKEIDSAGMYCDCGWPEDYDLWLRLAIRGERFARLPQKLLFWRERPERATRTQPEYSAEAFRACKAHHLRRSFLKEAEEVVLAGAGLEGRAWARALMREGIAVRAWIDVDPKKIGRTLHGAPVVSCRNYRPDNDAFVLGTVGTRGARRHLRTWALEAGLDEGMNFICVT